MLAARPRGQEVEAQLAVFKRGALDLIEKGELAERIEQRLKTKKPLRVKFGMDPSGRNKLRPQLTREEVERNLPLGAGASSRSVG